MSRFSEKRLAQDLAEQIQDKISRKRWPAALIAVATLSAGLIGNFVFNKIEYAGALWTVTLLCLADLIFAVRRLSTIPWVARIIVDLVITALVWIPSYPIVHQEYRKQHAALYEGELRPRPDGKDYGSLEPILRVTNGAGGIAWSGKQSFKESATPLMQFGADKIKLYKDGKTIKFSTTMRDKQGNLVVEIIDNKWRVSRSETNCWDKNYNDDSLEVKDGRGRVVLQVRLFPNEVELQAEWQASENIFVTDGKYTNEDGIVPRFKYPSEDHWGELDTNYKELR